MAASRTETSYNTATYHDHVPPSELRPAIPPRPGQRQPKQQEFVKSEDGTAAARPALGSIAVPIHDNLPSTVPSDLIPPQANWVADSRLPS